MLAQPSHEQVQRGFQGSLHRAIAYGLRPKASANLGDKTFAAVDAVALEHPDATADLIAAAYDAFDREHGRG